MRKKVQRTLAETELHQAASAGDVNAVQEAIAKGANVNSQEEEHYITPLLWACAFGHFDVASYLVDAGADINYADENLDTPLNNAVSGGYVEIVRLLLERGADLRALDGCGHTPLEAAVAYEVAGDANRKKIVDAIVATGYYINTRNEALNNQTPLMVAVETAADTGNTQMVRYLISKGAGVEATDDEGYKATDYANMGDYADAALKALQA